MGPGHPEANAARRRRALLIANPAAKRVRRAGVGEIKRALEAAGLEVELRADMPPDEAARDARGPTLANDGRDHQGAHLTRGFDRIIAAGGDGTIRSVVCEADVPVALLPMGTSNSVARSLGIPLDLRKAIEVAASGRIRPIDLGEVSGPRVHAGSRSGTAGDGPDGGAQPFLLCASAGVDAEVARRYELTRGSYSSFGRYAVVAARTVFSHRHSPIDVLADETSATPRNLPEGARRYAATPGRGRLVAAGAKMVIAANMRVYGGWFTFAPGARADDGTLDLVALRSEGTVGLAAALMRGFLGLPQRPARALALRARWMRWETPAGADVPLQIDGEPAGFLPVEVTVRPGAVRLVTPGRD